MKEQLKHAVGTALVTLFPKKAVSLEKKGLTIPNSKFNLIERQMRHAILNKAVSKNNFDELSRIHNHYWVNQGKDFFSSSNSFKNYFLPNCTFIFDIAKEKILKNEVQFDTLVEIGTGNGDVLHYLESNFPKIDKFVGIDLSSEQIKINKEKYKENLRLEFINSEAFEWVKKEGRKNTVFMTSNGVFEYFSELQLREFIKYTYSLGRVLFIIIEPTELNQNFELNANSIPFGFEKSFSHNYCKIFQDFGFKISHHSKKQLHDHHDWEMNYILAEN
jgi:tRNA G46 methylase TrmB